MAEDWSLDVKKYASGADPKVIAGIVKYCGIALQNRDSSLVAFSDREETKRVRENFLKKKLALSQPDSELDKAIAGRRRSDEGRSHQESSDGLLFAGREVRQTRNICVKPSRRLAPAERFKAYAPGELIA